MRNRVIIVVLILLSILCSSCNKKKANAELTADTLLFTSNTGIQQVVMTCEVDASFVRKVELYDEYDNLIGKFKKDADGIYKYNLDVDTSLLDSNDIYTDLYFTAKIYLPMSNMICDEWISITEIDFETDPDWFNDMCFRRFIWNYLDNINYDNDSVEVRNEKLERILNESMEKGLIQEYSFDDDSIEYRQNMGILCYIDLSNKHTAGCN